MTQKNSAFIRITTKAGFDPCLTSPCLLTVVRFTTDYVFESIVFFLFAVVQTCCCKNTINHAIVNLLSLWYVYSFTFCITEFIQHLLFNEIPLN